MPEHRMQDHLADLTGTDAIGLDLLASSSFTTAPPAGARAPGPGGLGARLDVPKGTVAASKDRREAARLQHEPR